VLGQPGVCLCSGCVGCVGGGKLRGRLVSGRWFNRRPTPPSSGQPTAGFAVCRLPLMSNVGPLVGKARCHRCRAPAVVFGTVSGAAALRCGSGRRCTLRSGSRGRWPPRRPTPPSSGHAPASRAVPLMSNVVRPRCSAEGSLSFGLAARATKAVATCEAGARARAVGSR